MTPTGVVNEFRGKYAFLSNYYHAPFEWRKLTFPTAEHAFAYGKCNFADRMNGGLYQRDILAATKPGDAKKLGRSCPIDVAQWDDNKVQYMREIIHAKFSTGEGNLVGQLLNTGAMMLVEGNTWGDTFWGRCDGKGYNTLGVILMEERGVWSRGDNLADGSYTQPVG
jgi:ribA/ribD-fused uncharacterized protein